MIFKVAKPKLKEDTINTINELYLKILNRPVDEEGLSGYGTRLENGKISITELEKIIKESPEGKTIQNKLDKFHNKITRFNSLYNESEIRNLISSCEDSYALSKSGWYHSFKFGNVTVTNTRTDLKYQMWVAQGIPEDLSGKTVLDIGTADGFYSFLCEQRGAERVLAIDYAFYPGFDIAKKILNSNVERRILNVFDLDKINEKFDIVLLFGVYYHLDNPVLALQKILPKVTDTLFLAGHIIEHPEPILCYYDENEMNPNDETNWWIASPSCLINIAKRIGFHNSTMLDDLYFPNSEQTKESAIGIRKMEKVGTFKLSK